MKFFLVFILLLFLISFAKPETVETDNLLNKSLQNNNGSSFHKSSHILNPGLLYGGSQIGLEYEFGIADFLGIQIGGGYLGLNAGPNFHILRLMHVDLYLGPNVVFIPTWFCMPYVNLGSRVYFSKSARVGISGIIGIGFTGKNIIAGNLHYNAGEILYKIGLGIPVRIR